MACEYTGRLTKRSDGVLEFVLKDSFGRVISGTASKHGDFYAMIGTLGPTPEHLRLPGEDENRNPV
jgi:hypothetical protein